MFKVDSDRHLGCRFDDQIIWRAQNSLRDLKHFAKSGSAPVSAFFENRSGGWFEFVSNCCSW